MSNTTGVIIFVLKEIKNEYRILFLQRSGGRFKDQWWPVAGTCEAEEEPLKTVVRELKEETTLVPTRIYTLGRDVRHMNEISKLESFVVFVPPESEVHLNYEHSKFKWSTVQEAIELVPEPIREKVQHVEHMRHIEDHFIKQEPNETYLILQYK